MPEKVKRPGGKVRRKQIIEAATEEFGKKNYHWATTKEIADRAGVSERTVFFYFNNKKELYKNVFEQAFNDFMQAVMRANPPMDDFRTFFKMTGRNLISFIHENPVKVKLLMQGIDVMEDPELKEDFMKMMDAYYKFVHSFVELAQQRGEISKDASLDAVVVLMAGVYVIAVYAEILNLDWFRAPEHDEIDGIVDYFIDNITGAEVKPMSPAARKDAAKLRNEIKMKGGLN